MKSTWKKKRGFPHSAFYENKLQKEKEHGYIHPFPGYVENEGERTIIGFTTTVYMCRGTTNYEGCQLWFVPQH